MSSDTSSSETISSDKNTIDVGTIDVTIPVSEDTNNQNSTGTTFDSSSSSGLSTGAICAIAIPCIAGLLGVAGAASIM